MVYLNPPNAVIFREAKEDGKSASQIEINNKSKDYIMFKVKTTEPNNYIVRPNQGVIEPDKQTIVKIICQVNLAQSILTDKFLVQLAVTSKDNADLTGEVIGGMLKQCKKDQIVQYKLKVEVQQQSARTGSLPDPRASKIEDQSARNTMVGSVYQPANSHSASRIEESKIQQSSSDPYEQYDLSYKRLVENQRELAELQQELIRLKDNRDLLKLKNSALNFEKPEGGAGAGAGSKGNQGYQLLHVLLVAIISLIIGALMKQ
ncbi:vesicle-associated protein 1-3-like [Stylonychia lemnae]|uniref:Vesicle-associated protein 1-3-like n=1 Tax=Stylonychia lemnae TaxID=5949 RepID=A0A078AW36_STYLE|nr:vesicle-associated protein 1-3-like [Stylonychia lemnae]|eukprot:CDW85432.1 vesicle-associated protein 1-3-like [Stylonychia lemnae]